MLQCCSVVSVECCMFSVYISHIPQYLHIYRFTHCWLTLCSPVQTVGRMQPRKQTITRLHTLLSSSLPFIFWTDFTKPVPAENATYCDAPHTSHSKPDRIIMSHTTQNINLMPDASVYIRVFSSAFISGNFSHALKNGPPRPILY